MFLYVIYSQGKFYNVDVKMENTVAVEAGEQALLHCNISIYCAI